VPSVILLDVDEVLFPFAHAYDRWLRRNARTALDVAHLARYDIPAAAGTRHDELVVRFLADPYVITGEVVIKAAVPVLQQLGAHHRLIACTSRHGHDEGDATRAWLAAHVPVVEDVIFTRHHRGEAARSKASVAQELGAVMLVDDTAEHLRGLPPSCTGILLTRPAGLPSEPGAVPWSLVPR
jgi:hypothetical protein